MPERPRYGAVGQEVAGGNFGQGRGRGIESVDVQEVWAKREKWTAEPEHWSALQLVQRTKSRSNNHSETSERKQGRSGSLKS
ncbi:hypothetical protein MRS44_012889 [Fusarium solani]|uniref:uncharacterized protein n=1 Tax=Fusarium solani TaxID=169388 RepID=UPI0032C4126D|nr:hypothetical protein MRS44_012889 [Fusarium solani]